MQGTESPGPTVVRRSVTVLDFVLASLASVNAPDEVRVVTVAIEPSLEATSTRPSKEARKTTSSIVVSSGKVSTRAFPAVPQNWLSRCVRLPLTVAPVILSALAREAPPIQVARMTKCKLFTRMPLLYLRFRLESPPHGATHEPDPTGDDRADRAGRRRGPGHQAGPQRAVPADAQHPPHGRGG